MTPEPDEDQSDKFTEIMEAMEERWMEQEEHERIEPQEYE